jgi:hypothetical protein
MDVLWNVSHAINDALPFFIPHLSIWMWFELEPPIPLIPIDIEALVEEIFLSFIVSSKTNQLLANLDNFFMVIFPKKLGAQIALIVGVIIELPSPYQIITP